MGCTPVPFTVGGSFDQHLNPFTDPILGTLGHELVHQCGDLFDPVRDLTGRDLGWQSLPFGPFLVGVAEDSHGIEPG